MINICFLDEYSVHGADISAIRALGNYTGYDYTEPEQVAERCAAADVVITNKTKLTGGMLAALPRLRLVCIAATGMNNIDLEAAERLGITVRNAVDYSTGSVAEATLAGVLALLRQTIYYDTFVKNGGYASSGRLFHFGRGIGSLEGKRWGVIGMGNIGRRVASIAVAFGAEVVCSSPSGKRYESPYAQLPLDELLRTSDIVSVHTPLTDLTRNLLDYPQLSSMKPSALIANYSRGPIIDEAALARCLDEGRIAGAAMDVYSREPIREDNPLLAVKDLSKLVLSPHNAWASADSIQRLVDRVEENIRIFYGLD